MLTLKQLMAATGCKSKARAEALKPYIIEAVAKYDINTPIRQLCFLAQVGHESGGLFYTEELASGAAYEGRKSLGNTQPGDGVRFKGRGLIQITGRANYGAVGRALGVDLIKSPTLLGAKNARLCSPDQLKYAALSAGWFWHNRKLNAIADKMDIRRGIVGVPVNFDNYRLITRTINGGFNGWQDRVDKWLAGQNLFINNQK